MDYQTKSKTYEKRRPTKPGVLRRGQKRYQLVKDI